MSRPQTARRPERSSAPSTSTRKAVSARAAMDGSGVGRRRHTGSWTDGNAAAGTLREGVSGACTRLGAACFLRRPCEKRVSGQIAPESDDGLRAAGVRHVCDTQKLRSSVADSRVAVKEHPGLRQAGTAGLSQKGFSSGKPDSCGRCFSLLRHVKAPPAACGDEKANLTCHRGGSCAEVRGEAKCVCRPGFTGER